MKITEKINKKSILFHEMSIRDQVGFINGEDRKVSDAVKGQLDAIAQVISVAVATIQSDGSVIYVGAGTSGRLAMLDVSELKPTFNARPWDFRAIIAGGRRALTQAIEGAEDDEAAGREAIRLLCLKENFLVIGLSVSGGAPFVIAALDEARKKGGKTAVITCDPEAAICKKVDFSVTPEVGAEVVAGSSRMKAGTAQKMILNIISTCTYAQLGKVYQGCMIDVEATNKKLSARQVSIVRHITDASEEKAKEALLLARNNLKVALLMIMLKTDARNAYKILVKNKNNFTKTVKENAL